MKEVTGAQLARAWERYEKLFGVPPHGTENQMKALLELVEEPFNYAAWCESNGPGR